MNRKKCGQKGSWSNLNYCVEIWLQQRRRTKKILIHFCWGFVDRIHLDKHTPCVPPLNEWLARRKGRYLHNPIHYAVIIHNGSIRFIVCIHLYIWIYLYVYRQTGLGATQPLLYNGYRNIPKGKPALAWRWQPPSPSSIEVKGRVELCASYSSVPSWQVIVWTISFTGTLPQASRVWWLLYIAFMFNVH